MTYDNNKRALFSVLQYWHACTHDVLVTNEDKMYTLRSNLIT